MSVNAITGVELLLLRNSRISMEGHREPVCSTFSFASVGEIVAPAAEATAAVVGFCATLSASPGERIISMAAKTTATPSSAPAPILTPELNFMTNSAERPLKPHLLVFDDVAQCSRSPTVPTNAFGRSEKADMYTFALVQVVGRGLKSRFACDDRLRSTIPLHRNGCASALERLA